MERHQGDGEGDDGVWRVQLIADDSAVECQGQVGRDRGGLHAAGGVGEEELAAFEDLEQRLEAVLGVVAAGALLGQGRGDVGGGDAAVALRLLADRRDELGAARTLTVNRLHRLLLELVPGGAKTFLSATQAKALLATIRPHDVVGKTRRRLAAELIVELDRIDKKMKTASKQLTELVQATGSTLLELTGIGPSGAARLLGDVGDVSRFQTRGHFASWNGTAPIDASSGEQNRHRLSRAGNRRINRVLHIMAIVQLRNDTEGRAYYRRKLAAGKTPMEAIRALKRRLSDIVYRQLVNDQKRLRQKEKAADPGGQAGAATGSSAAGSNPDAGTSEKSLPGPTGADSTPTAPDHPNHSSTRSRRPRQAPTRSRRQAQSA